MGSPNVTLYVTSWCPYCTRARALLDRKGVAYTAIDIESAAGLRDEMMAKAAGRRSVPQIFIGDHHVGGCDDLHALEAAGSLNSLLGLNS
jgi:glutaredoxin 3